MARGLTSFSAIEKAILSGDMLLWVVWDGTQILAAAVTQLTGEDNRKVGTIVALGGTCLDRFAHLRSTLEDHFRDEGCAISRVFGRKGWARHLKDYEMTSLVLEKAL